MATRNLRTALNSWLPQKTRIVLSAVLDLVDLGADLALTITIASAARGARGLLPSDSEGGALLDCVEIHGFIESFCRNGGVSDLSTLCTVSFVLGACGMVVTLFLRRKEFIELQRSERAKSHFVVVEDSNRQMVSIAPGGGALLTPRSSVSRRGLSSPKIAPLTTVFLPPGEDPELFSRHISRLHSQRSSKIASLVT